MFAAVSETPVPETGLHVFWPYQKLQFPKIHCSSKYAEGVCIVRNKIQILVWFHFTLDWLTRKTNTYHKDCRPLLGWNKYTLRQAPFPKRQYNTSWWNAAFNTISKIWLSYNPSEAVGKIYHNDVYFSILKSQDHGKYSVVASITFEQHIKEKSLPSFVEVKLSFL